MMMGVKTRLILKTNRENKMDEQTDLFLEGWETSLRNYIREESYNRGYDVTSAEVQETFNHIVDILNERNDENKAKKRALEGGSDDEVTRTRNANANFGTWFRSNTHIAKRKSVRERGEARRDRISKDKENKYWARVRKQQAAWEASRVQES